MSADESHDHLDTDTLREIVEGTSAETGERFFDELVKHLAGAMGVACAWATEWYPEENRLRAISFWVRGDYVQDFEYDIAGTPCEPAITQRQLAHVPEKVIELYKTDESLVELGAVSYLGVPLFDTDDSIMGHLAVLDDKPMAADPRLVAIFNIFAHRAAAEMRRVKRDKALAEREQKLSRLIGSAMDAIVELNGDLTVTGLNQAAREVFEQDPAKAVGSSLETFLTTESRGKLVYLTRQLDREDEARQSVWIPDGLTGVRSGGAQFPAEATLSRFELGGRSFYTLILRDVDQKLEAESRIRSLLDETDYLRAELKELQGFDDIMGESDALRRVLVDVDKVAGGDTTVLITGETGTGKELIARAIHERSPRSSGPLIRVNCAAVAANLQESEFFGHEKGAFTGATQRREGRFKLADGGTIFLDEVGEMPLDLQAKLLRVLQEGEFEPVGGSRPVKVNVRVITATNRDLERMVAEGTFRRDLLYRLNVFPIHMPPLRDRGDDAVLLAQAFADGFARERGLSSPRLTPDDRVRIKRYEWPGNVRELHNVIERAIITSSDGRTLNLERALPETDVPAGAPPAASTNPTAVLTATELIDLERANMVRALEAADWKISGAGGAAELLGLKPNTLTSRMKVLGIKRPS
jgi:PAS domain S-box-containing protein